MARVTLLKQRRFWLPTASGLLLLLLICVVIGYLMSANLYSYLAQNEPVGARVLVVEGWMDPEELDQAIQTFNKGNYEHVVTTGGPVIRWHRMSTVSDYATQAAEYLGQHGISPELISAVPAPKSRRERTFLSAVTFRESAQRLGISLDAVDVFSAGPHARRTRLLFQMALGPGVRVGVFSARPTDFDPEAWWRTRAGVEQMIYQSFGFVWVKCCFWPGPLGSKEEL